MPTSGGYKVKVEVQNATSVEAVLGSERVALAQVGASDKWQGQVPVDPTLFSKSGEPLTIVAGNSTGRPDTATLAFISPSTDTQKFYIFNEGNNRFTKLFGYFRIQNLEDSVRRFYVSFIVLLAGALLLNLFLVRLKIHHPSVVTHTVAVILLAVVFTIIYYLSDF